VGHSEGNPFYLGELLRTLKQTRVLRPAVSGTWALDGLVLVAGMGVAMRRFPTPAHLAAGAGVAPGNNERGGRRRSGQTRQDNPWLKTALVQAAHGAARAKGTALAARYQRIASRRGAKRAIMAVAHRLLLSVYQVLARREPYRERGADYSGPPAARCNRRSPPATVAPAGRHGAGTADDASPSAGR